MNAPDAASWIASRFDEDGIEYAIGGALALIAWGAPRSTADVSAFVARRELDRVLGSLERAGVMVPADAAKTVERIGMFRGLMGRVPVDVFTSEHPHQQAMRERRCQLELTEGTLRWFVSPEDLAVLKLLYARPKDELDLERLFAVRTNLDFTYVEGWLARMVPAGDRRLELFNRLRDRA
jgi:hypothetical protein